MAWIYRITAAARPRLAMRVAQIFDQQLLEVEHFHLVREDAVTTIRISVDCGEPIAHRIHAKLYRLADVVRVDLTSEVPLGAIERELYKPSSPLYLDPLCPQP